MNLIEEVTMCSVLVLSSFGEGWPTNKRQGLTDILKAANHYDEIHTYSIHSLALVSIHLTLEEVKALAFFTSLGAPTQTTANILHLTIEGKDFIPLFKAALKEIEKS